ncbi:MAG TPA: hypothetical protein VEU62_00335 [Bryobacterales bacterium]|nr:hypothetical protein [Bryobacterales bacterium]
MRAVILVLLLGGLIAAGPRAALAKDHSDHDRKHWNDDDEQDREHHRKYGDACFRDDDLRVIHDYYRPRSLPPGLQKKLYRTGHLPPGWEKKIQRFPDTVERRLPPLCSGCARGYMDGYAIVYQPRSRLIIDIHGVFTP